MSDIDDKRDFIPSAMFHDFQKVTGKVLKDFLKPMQVKFKKLHPDAVTPTRATSGSAGWDLTALGFAYIDEEGEEFETYTGIAKYRTGIAVEIPPGYVGLVFPRSSLFKTGMDLTNCVGVIDSDYRGELAFIFRVIDIGKKYDIGNRIGQLVIIPCPAVELVEVEELSQTERGSGGFGSTGK